LISQEIPHPAFGHLLPQEGREKAQMIIAFSRFFQREKVPEGRMREVNDCLNHLLAKQYSGIILSEVPRFKAGRLCSTGQAGNEAKARTTDRRDGYYE
jgi:hypothetical protein